MTREEAWNRIDAIIARHEIDDVYVTITSLLDYDALRMARKLLEQEPCTDAISRQAVLDHIYGVNGLEGLELSNVFEKHYADFIKSLPPVKPQYTDAEIQKMQDLEFAEIQKAYEIGKEEGSEEKPNKWIPVSERLPEFIINNTVSEDVLVFDGVDIRVGEYRKGMCLNGAEYWRVYGYEDEYVDVIAWMPLPEPYKASPTGEEVKE